MGNWFKRPKGKIDIIFEYYVASYELGLNIRNLITNLELIKFNEIRIYIIRRFIN